MANDVVSNELVGVLAKTAGMDGQQFVSAIKTQCFGGAASDAQLLIFLNVARKYELDPFVGEIYAFVDSKGRMHVGVSIDGWLKIANRHPAFDGVAFQDVRDRDGKLSAITCRIYRKDRAHPVEFTEYMNECADLSSATWKKWPARMLRHKSYIQCARYAFAISEIVDPDEIQRIRAAVDGSVVQIEPPIHEAGASLAPPPDAGKVSAPEVELPAANGNGATPTASPTVEKPDAGNATTAASGESPQTQETKRRGRPKKENADDSSDVHAQLDAFIARHVPDARVKLALNKYGVTRTQDLPDVEAAKVLALFQHSYKFEEATK